MGLRVGVWFGMCVLLLLAVFFPPAALTDAVPFYAAWRAMTHGVPWSDIYAYPPSLSFHEAATPYTDTTAFVSPPGAALLGAYGPESIVLLAAACAGYYLLEACINFRWKLEDAVEIAAVFLLSMAALAWGQTSPMFLVLPAAFVPTERREDRAGLGLIFGIITLLKLFPLALLPFLGLDNRGSRQIAYIGLAVFLCANALVMGYWGAESVVEWSRIAQYLSERTYTNTWALSLPAMIMREITGIDGELHYVPQGVSLVAWMVKAGIFGGALGGSLGFRDRPNVRAKLAIAAMISVSPLMWAYYLVAVPMLARGAPRWVSVTLSVGAVLAVLLKLPWIGFIVWYGTVAHVLYQSYNARNEV